MQLEDNQKITLMAHLYRAQVGRADLWRCRLDSTTNWAVITTAAALTTTFSQPAASPTVLIMCTILVTIFLGIESRRYRYYELWNCRLRLLERGLLTDSYSSWREALTRSLDEPQFPISSLEAFGRRYLVNYIWLYAILAVAWLVHVWAHPVPSASLVEMMSRQVLGVITVRWALLVGILFNLTLLGLSLLGVRRTKFWKGEPYEHTFH